MDAFLNRYRSYRSLVVLVVVIMAQLLYLAYQVKTGRDERLIRVWAVSAVTPFSGIVEAIRHNTVGFLKDYFLLLDVREQNTKLKRDNDRLRMENVFYRNQLATAEHLRALAVFQAKTPSKTVAARVIGDSTVGTAKAVFIDRGSTSNIEKGMAVVTPTGIVGKIAAVYPLTAQVLLATDPTFKVGVESQRGHIHGSLDCGIGHCVVEQIENQEDVKAGEWFYTSGEDRIFPRGFPVGTVVSAQPGNGMKDVQLNLSGAPGGAEEVLVVIEGVHQAIPANAAPEDKMALPLNPPQQDTPTEVSGTGKSGVTEADRTLSTYQELGKEQNHAYGTEYSNLPNFAVHPGAQGAAANPPNTAAPGTAAPPASTHPSAAGGPVILGAPNPKPNATAQGTQANSPAPAMGAPARPKATRAPAPQPALPLGAPHPKPPQPGTATKPDTSTPPQPQ